MIPIIVRGFRSPKPKRCFKSNVIRDKVMGSCLGDAGRNVRSILPFIPPFPFITFE